MAAVLHDSHHPTKQCTSASCCSPSRLWKSIQSMIANDSRDAFTTLSQDPERAPHLTRVLLTLRAANDPLLFPASHKHRVIQFDLPIRSEAVRKFGKQVTDLNALQLALLQRRDGMAHLILGFLRQTASPKEVQIFVNHLWGQRNSSLHVACFLNMPRLVRLLLDCGADPAFRNARNLGPVDCSHPDCLSALGPQNYFASVQIDQKKRLGAQQDTIYPVTDDLISRPTLSPLSFSSSSSTSSFSSLSSVEEPIQDTAKAASSTPLDRCWSPPALPSAPSPASEWDSWAIQGSLKLPRPSEKHTHPPRQVHFMPQIVLVDACVRGDLTELTEIIDRTIEQSGIFSMRHTTGDVHNRSLLHLALMHGHESVVRYLVQDANINMNHPDNDGWTALHYAAALGLWDSLEYLASCKEANLQAKTQHGLCIQDCPESPVDRKRCRCKYIVLVELFRYCLSL
ncbi:ankyrin repeat-containing domain protein [Phycomyces blakesleeanus]|uniref:Ankyrin repeat-containing domain protein n=1 Tax=Phycomyces blakesleeanus TaxID=4837 RepID=A0ABR3BDC9_PHYBL